MWRTNEIVKIFNEILKIYMSKCKKKKKKSKKLLSILTHKEINKHLQKVPLFNNGILY